MFFFGMVLLCAGIFSSHHGYNQLFLCVKGVYFFCSFFFDFCSVFFLFCRCRCKVSFDMQNFFEYKPALKRCHLVHLNDNKYRCVLFLLARIVYWFGTSSAIVCCHAHFFGEHLILICVFDSPFPGFNPSARSTYMTKATSRPCLRCTECSVGNKNKLILLVSFILL